MPRIMKIIISGQASTSAATSSVDAGTPSATRPTTPIARAMAYRPQCWRFMTSPFLVGCLHRAPRYRGGVCAKVTPDRAECPYPVGVYGVQGGGRPAEGERHGRRGHRCPAGLGRGVG